MKKKVYLIFSVIAMLSVASCFDSLICIDGNGLIETQRRNASQIDQIENLTEFDIIYTKSDTSGIAVIADQNLFDNIVTEISGTTLQIRTNPREACFNYRQRPVIQVSSSGLKGVFSSGSGNLIADYVEGNPVTIKLTGSGDVKAEHIRCTNLSALLSGSGNITLDDIICTESEAFISGSGNIFMEGTVDKGTILISGSGNLHADNYIAETASATISGSGNAFTHILEKLTGIISGSGNIYVKGNPEIDVTVSGSGHVIRN